MTKQQRQSVVLNVSKVPLTKKEISSSQEEKDDNDGTSSTTLSRDSNTNENQQEGAGTNFPTTAVISTIPPVSKFRQLKDIMWIRETLEDLTGAEFALSVESESQVVVTINGGGGPTTTKSSSSSLPSQQPPPRKKKRAVDYEKLMSQLTKRVEDMTRIPFMEGGSDFSTMVEELKEDQGMGRLAYTREQRAALLERLLSTRANLVEVVKAHMQEDEEEETQTPFLQMPEIPELRVDVGDSAATSSGGPMLYVREDGTVDWEGALQDRAALRKFGSAVWARINGQTPDDIDEEEEDGDSADGSSSSTTTTKSSSNAVTTSAAGGHGQKSKSEVIAKIEETAAIKEAREELNRLISDLDRMEKAHTALLATGIKAGQPVANVRLASLDPVLRNKIRQSAEALLIMEQQVSYQDLVYELERIYTYLATELGNPANKGYIPLQDRLNVAEYGLLESQIESCSRELNTKGVLDADILAVIAEQMTDFKRRLGIDYYVTGLTYDREAIQRWVNDLLVQTKNGILFYVKGCRLFWNDIIYCISLIGRAAQGYTLKPREVRTLRRTFKDIITFIPVVIILIIPLSPVGHVLVFGAIQRFFPDFFPSCFTEQRQNLLQLYETTEFSEVTIKESLQERLTRFLEAFAFFVATKAKNTYMELTGSDTTIPPGDDDGSSSSSSSFAGNNNNSNNNKKKPPSDSS